jgi:phosphopantothenoylcysteine decarboxylase/phosphopantothenate--cysteine ligase
MLNASPIRCLITAGPTREFLDPVRFLSNPSTGKMGYALAVAAVEAGWTVDLVSGPVALTEPDGVVLYPVVTAEEMYHQVDALFDACDILIMSAAVCDFRPLVQHSSKEKKDAASKVVEFERTVDILKTVTERKLEQTVVGFAAETDDLEVYSRRKLIDKRCDWVVANDVSKSGSGFASESNEILLLGAEGTSESYGPLAKEELAHWLIQRFSRS